MNVTKSLRILLLCSLAAPATVAFAPLASAQSAYQAGEQARREIQRSREESRRNLDDGVKGKKPPKEVRRNYGGPDVDGDGIHELDPEKEKELEQLVLSSFSEAMAQHSEAPARAAVEEVIAYYTSLDQEVSDQEEAFEEDRRMRERDARRRTPKKPPAEDEQSPYEEEAETPKKTAKELRDELYEERRRMDYLLQHREQVMRDNPVQQITYDGTPEDQRRQRAERNRIEANELIWDRQQRIKDADRRYREHLQQNDPAEYERYDREQRETQRDIRNRDLDRRDGPLPPTNPNPPKKDQSIPQEYDGPNGEGPGGPPEGPSNPLGVKDYDGPQGQESERRLQGGQDAYQADRVIAPGGLTSSGTGTKGPN
jgi:hypothetical protein